MTEQEFDQKVEDLAARFEQYVDTSADKLDKNLTHAWNNSRIFRLTTGGTSILAGIGLIIGARQLAESGHKNASLWCFILGVSCLLSELIRFSIFRRKK